MRVAREVVEMSPGIRRSGAAWLLLSLLGLSLVVAPGRARSSEDAFFPSIDDTQRDRNILVPEWFTPSFLDLRDDLERALERGRMGIALYFGLEHCAYCERMLHENLAEPDIRLYLSDHFDVIALDVEGSREVTTLEGETMTERVFAAKRRLNFTPGFTFIDAEGKEIFRIRGYYPPYRFRAALEYVIDRHDRDGSFREYLERADPPPKFEVEDINEREFFARPPHMLDRSQVPAQRPLVVFFERRSCHACDVLHSEPLSDPGVIERVQRFDAVQLDLDAETPLVTPDGERTTAREWGQRLEIHWAPSILFFDEAGQEIIRIDSVVGLHRLSTTMDYVLTRAYQEFPTYRRWRTGNVE
jgi:thioredoxin-related protein